MTTDLMPFDFEGQTLRTEEYAGTVRVACVSSPTVGLEAVELAIDGYVFHLTGEDADLIGRVLIEAAS